MRRVLIVIVLSLVLAALVLVNRALPPTRALITGQPGELLYAAAFDTDAPFNADWEQYPGRLSAEIISGALRVSVGDAGSGANTTAAPAFRDFDARVEARPVEGVFADANENGFGLVFRLQDAGTPAFTDDSYYLFVISVEEGIDEFGEPVQGNFRLDRVVNGSAHRIVEWTPSPAINQGLNAVNELRVVGRGGTFAFYINGERLSLCMPDTPTGTGIFILGGCVSGSTLQDTMIDDAIAEGQIGFGVVATDVETSPVTVTFDNLIVYSPDEE